MPLYTDHLNLIKPSWDERYEVEIPNTNMDLLDEAIQLLWDEIESLRRDTDILRQAVERRQS